MSDPDWRSRLVSVLAPVGARVVEAYGRTGPLRYKVGREAVTHVDAEIESFLATRIHSEFPDHAIVGEEHGRSGPEGAAFEWHVDPVDGTLNYALGLPVFSVAVAVVHDGVIEAGAVVDPLRGDLYVAARGEGAWRGDERLVVSDRSTLREAIASFQSSRQGRFVRDAEILQRVFSSISKVRRLGSVALELAFVADGRLDLLLASKHRPQNLYDVAAGMLLVEEAGGAVTDGRGAPFREGANELVVSNGHVHAAALELVRPSEGGGS